MGKTLHISAIFSQNVLSGTLILLIINPYPTVDIKLGENPIIIAIISVWLKPPTETILSVISMGETP